jgi:hypothetical protein
MGQLVTPALGNEKENVLDKKVDTSDQFLILRTECVVGWKNPYIGS